MKIIEANGIAKTTATGSGTSGPLTDPSSFTYQLSASSGGFQNFQIWQGGRLHEQLTLSTAEASALGAALTAGTALKGP